MTLSDQDTAHVLAALALLLVSAHGCGYVFARLRQPPVIGEILGGLLLGPTILGRLAPSAHDWLFPAAGATSAVLGAVYQLGLLLLMFTAGAQMRGLVHRSAVRTVSGVAIAGLVIPFVAGVGVFAAVDLSGYEGAAHNRTAFLLVFAIALAVTSIPVIARIMLDLDLLDTRFARIVLSVAVIEDIVLYVVLAVALGFVAGDRGSQFGLSGTLGLHPGSAASNLYHTLATLLFLVAALVLGPRLYGRVLRSRFNLVKRRSQIGFQLVVMIAMSAACLLLSVVPLFGAFVSGIVVAATPGERSAEARAEIGNVAFGLFIPIYFAIVGLGLDLIDHFDPLFFLAFLTFACAVKSVSVYLGARVTGERHPSAVNLAVAMNARGGPGIVLASTAYAAGIIDQSFYATLVMLAIVTSLIAGTWLQRTVATAYRGAPRDLLATGS